MANTQEIRKLRKKYFVRQNGRCFYCKDPTWLPEELLHNAKQRLEYDYQKLLLKQATYEHLKRVQDGGKIRNKNGVMSCYECNSKRAKQGWLIHLLWIRWRITIDAQKRNNRTPSSEEGSRS